MSVHARQRRSLLVLVGTLVSCGLALGGQATAAELVVNWDFESDDGGFISGGDLAEWEWGEPTVGPAAATSGSLVWGTDLDDLYLRENTVTLTLPSLDLSSVSDPVLVSRSWLDLADGDSARLEADLGSGFETVTPVYGYGGTETLISTNASWQALHLDLTGIDDLSDVRLVLRSDAGRAMGWYVDDVAVWSGDAVPPRISEVSAPDSWQLLSTGPTIEATIQDNRGLSSIAVVWSTETVAETRTGFSSLGSSRWTATLPPIPPGTITWRIEAADDDNLSLWPNAEDEQIEVFLPAPQELSGPTSRTWGTSFDLSWDPPDSDELVIGYRVYRDDELLAEVTQDSATVSAQGPVDLLSVSAVYDTTLGEIEGDLSGPIEVDIAVPVLGGLQPDQAYQGDTLRLAVSGSALLMSDSELSTAALDLGEGVAIIQAEVVNVDQAIFTIQVETTAATGVRDAVLSLGNESLLLDGAFTVVSGDDRPALMGVSPNELEQGASDILVLTLSDAPNSVPTIDLGDGVVIQEVRVDGTEVTIDVAVANSAALGLRDVQLDDGVRILDLSDGFRVRARTEQLPKGCSTLAPRSVGPLPGSALLALSVLGLWFRRRRAPWA